MKVRMNTTSNIRCKTNMFVRNITHAAITLIEQIPQTYRFLASFHHVSPCSAMLTPTKNINTEPPCTKLEFVHHTAIMLISERANSLCFVMML